MGPRSAAARVTGALIAVALGLASCSSKKSPEPEPTGPVSGGILRVAVRDMSSLDPAKATGRGAVFVLSQVFRPLTTIDEAGNAAPGAAASWKTSADGLTYDFTLADAKFHDGSKVQAGDFKFAFDRIALKATKSDTAFQLEPVAGWRDAKVAGTAKSLAGITVVSGLRLRIKLDRPFAELPRFLAHRALGPIARGAFKAAGAAGYAGKPVGNGPFKIDVARGERQVTLRRHEEFFGTKAYLDGIDLEVRSDLRSVWEDLRGGDLHVGEVPPGRIDEARKRFGTSGFAPFWATVYYGFNLKLPKLAKPEVRRAISLAIDRAELVRTVYTSTKREATGIIPAGIEGSRADPCEACRYDLSRARSLLDSAFKGKSPDFTIDHLDASPSRELARAVSTMLGEAGLRVSVRAHSPAAYLKLLRSGKHEIAELGWLSDVPSPDPFLAQQLRTGSTNNHTGFADKTFDRQIDAARKASSESVRLAAYTAAETRALAALPLAPLVFFESHIATRGSVRGFRLDGAGVFDASKIWLAPKSRA